MNKYKRISLVIPVYNEADRIRACLQAIARQTVQPYEVLVIDNNSTDGTAAIAGSFPFVRLLREPRQGVVYARDRGFNAARGDIIARIDGDSIISNDWIATLIDLFADPQIDLVTGSVSVREIGAAKLASRVDLFWRRYLHRRLGTLVGLQGANMALRRQVWQAIKREVCHESGLHEDFDIGLHANRHGYAARFAEELRVSVCHRQCGTGFWRFADYALTGPRTYLYHGVSKGRVMYQVVAFVLLVYPIICMLTRGYDERLSRFSLAQLFSASLPPRVNPATFID
ncbi:MAG: putative glycosyltransferase [Candidatus Saccharibacteria bacterium]|nr:putative glycosyltransferase [Candidatus Saccharibacteria bacterium]